MKYLALLISISFISFLLPVSAKEQSKSQKSLLKTSTHKKAKQHAKKHCKNISSIKTGNQRLEARLSLAITGCRQGSHRSAMKRFFHHDNGRRLDTLLVTVETR